MARRGYIVRGGKARAADRSPLTILAQRDSATALAARRRHADRRGAADLVVRGLLADCTDDQARAETLRAISASAADTLGEVIGKLSAASHLCALAHHLTPATPRAAVGAAEALFAPQDQEAE